MIRFARCELKASYRSSFLRPETQTGAALSSLDAEGAADRYVVQVKASSLALAHTKDIALKPYRLAENVPCRCIRPHTSAYVSIHLAEHLPCS